MRENHLRTSERSLSRGEVHAGPVRKHVLALDVLARRRHHDARSSPCDDRGAPHAIPAPPPPPSQVVQSRRPSRWRTRASSHGAFRRRARRSRGSADGLGPPKVNGAVQARIETLDACAYTVRAAMRTRARWFGIAPRALTIVARDAAPRGRRRRVDADLCRRGAGGSLDAWGGGRRRRGPRARAPPRGVAAALGASGSARAEGARARRARAVVSIDAVVAEPARVALRRHAWAAVLARRAARRRPILEGTLGTLLRVLQAQQLRTWVRPSPHSFLGRCRRFFLLPPLDMRLFLPTAILLGRAPRRRRARRGADAPGRRCATALALGRDGPGDEWEAAIPLTHRWASVRTWRRF